MGWKTFFKSLGKRNRPASPDSPTKINGVLETGKGVTSLKELRVPTSGMRASRAHRDYYVLVFNRNYPSLVWDEPQLRMLDSQLQPNSHLNESELALAHAPLHLRIQPAENGNTELVDFHLGSTPVVSHAVMQKLMMCRLPGIDFFPTDLRSTEGSPQAAYYALYVDQELSCLDEENSHFQSEDEGGAVALEKIALNSDALDSIELEQRLLFRLTESGREYLFHQNLVDLIVESGFTGAHFISVEDWRLSRY